MINFADGGKGWVEGAKNINFALNTGSFVSKTRNCVSKSRDSASKTRNCVSKHERFCIKNEELCIKTRDIVHQKWGIVYPNRKIVHQKWWILQCWNACQTSTVSCLVRLCIGFRLVFCLVFNWFSTDLGRPLGSTILTDFRLIWVDHLGRPFWRTALEGKTEKTKFDAKVGRVSKNDEFCIKKRDMMYQKREIVC